jgi:hypothetical protein
MKRLSLCLLTFLALSAAAQEEPIAWHPLIHWGREQGTKDWVVLLDRVNQAPVTGAVAVVEEIRVPIPATVQAVSMQYAGVMQAYFGAGAHTNRSISYDQAAAFFMSRVPFGVDDARAVLLLTQAIPVLRQFSEDNTAWTFPFGQSELVLHRSTLRPLSGPSEAETVLGRAATMADVLALTEQLP